MHLPLSLAMDGYAMESSPCEIDGAYWEYLVKQ